MKKLINNRKGIAPLFIILFALLGIIFIYALLWLPFFSNFRTRVNYFLIILLFIIIQAGLVLAYYKLIRVSITGFDFLKIKIMNVSNRIKRFLVFHS